MHTEKERKLLVINRTIVGVGEMVMEDFLGIPIETKDWWNHVRAESKRVLPRDAKQIDVTWPAWAIGDFLGEYLVLAMEGKIRAEEFKTRNFGRIQSAVLNREGVGV